MKKRLSLLFIIGFYATVFSQNEASFWYFGQNAGVRFDAEAGTVTAITDGQLNTLEGCTTISDTGGNLMLYTDGRTVWNRNHQVMANGNYAAGTGLLGDPSSTSSGLIVPKPEDPSKYYIFTVDEPHHENASVYPNQFLGPYSNGQTIPTDDDGFNNGFNYSLVDMTLNGGLGDVDTVEKNIPLVTYDPNDPDEIKYKCSEKITAVRAEDCSSFWVITHFGDTFYAFKVDTSGVSTTPVISTVGPYIPIEGYRRNALGYLKASPDGSKLVAAHFGEATTIGGDAGGGVYLFDFSNDTGIVSNALELYSPQNNDSPYGVEFSAENRKVYASLGAGIGGGGPSQILQWDLESTNIPASMQVVHSSNTLSAGALQLGIDRRIYRAQLSFSFGTFGGQYLGVINNPEADGLAVNYDEQGVFLDVNGFGQNTSTIGLPPFIQSLFNSQTDIIRNGLSTTELKLCTGDSYTLSADNIPGADYVWTVDGNPLTEISFELFVDTPGFYEVYIEPNNGDCPIIGSAVVGVFEIPVANPLTDISICDDDNDEASEFFFSNKDQEALLNQDPSVYSVGYFETLDDATNFTNEISLPYTNSNNPQEIYVRVYNEQNPNCFDINSFTLSVYDTPIINAIEPISFCDNFDNIFDGIATLELSELTALLLGNQDSTNINLTFHHSQVDADNNSNSLPSSYTNINPFNETVFVRAQNVANPECFSTGSFNFNVNPAPEANAVALLQCDEDGIPEGFTTFNINQVLEDITGGNSGVVADYYVSYSDAENDLNPINGDSYQNSSNPQTIIARVTDINTGCSNYSEVSLEVSITASNDASLELCDTDGIEDGFITFNLSDANATVLAGLPLGLELDYYETYEDALVESNPIPNSFTNTIAYNQAVYARVENANACFGISEVRLTVIELPNIETTFDTSYCLNFFPESITLTGGVINDITNNYLYEWSTGETTSTIQVNNPGTYNVRVTNTSGCFKDRVITVFPSNIATITEINVVDASSNNSITILVSGEGDYEYALNNPNGPFQNSNTFENVQPGLYTVYVRDNNNCGIVEDIVSVIGFPKFFTPNGDAVNDYWQVLGIQANFQANSNILIFDKYGKLLKELDPLSLGWDGTINGTKMPTSDYWFKLTLEDGRTFTSHFTLKR